MRARLPGLRRSTWVGIGLLVVGALAVAVGWYPPDQAGALADRVWPVLLFVVAMTIVAELASEAGLFEVGADRVLRLGGRHHVRLWLLVSALALIGTIFLSLDTTAVLLTPVVVALAARAGVSPAPFVLTTLWLANTGSLLLPVSNLTNLLAEQTMGLGPGGFAALMWRPALVCAVVPLLAVAIVYRRELRQPVHPQPVHPQPVDETATAQPSDPHRRLLLGITASVVGVLMVALVSGVEVWIPALAAALVLAIAFAWLRPAALGRHLVPGSMIVLTCGLFLATSAVGYALLHPRLPGLVPDGDAAPALLGVAGLALVASNLVNNLPAFLLLEPLASSPLTHAALLVGVNAGPLITPWGSLATLLWHERLVRLGVEVRWRTVILAGAVLAPVTVLLAVLALAV